MTMEDTFRAIVREELRAFAGELRGDVTAGPELITTREAGKLLRKNPKAVGLLVKGKLLKRYGSSERILLSRAEVLALLNNPPVKRRTRRAKQATAESEATRLLESI